MAAESPADAPDWLGACRRSVAAIRTMLSDKPTIAERVIETGTRGEGGDRTLEIDQAAEDVVFAELQGLYDAGARFTAVSEERGVVSFGSEDLFVVIDPIDGSLNAKRGLPHFALSVAVADGPTMADVYFGFVQDFGPREEWLAIRGEGAWLDGVVLDPTLVERRNRLGKLEVVGVESADPRWVVQSVDALEETTHRIRAIGAIAVSLCQVAAARFDAMASLKRCRAVDAAAAQLIVREAGGLVSFIAFEDPLAAPLDLEGHSPVIAARTAAGLADIAKVPVWPQAERGPVPH
jgi:myo-inositol-1(or 4)-monophosphatase